MIIEKKIFDELIAKAKENPRLRCSCDLRNSAEEKNQRMLNAQESGTVMPKHRHWGLLRLAYVSVATLKSSSMTPMGG